VSGCDPVEGLAEGLPEFVDGSQSFASERGFDLGESLFDGIEVGTVGWEVECFRIMFGEHRDDGGDFVGGEVVHDDDIARFQYGRQDLSEISKEMGAGQSAINYHRGHEPRHAESAEKRRRFPMAVRHIVDDTLTDRPPTVEPSHRRGAERLVEENESTRVESGLDDFPFRPLLFDIRPLLFGGPE